MQYDIIFGVIILLFGLWGFKKGIIRSIASILGMIVGIYAAIKFSSFIAPMIPPFSWDLSIRAMIAFLLIIFLFWLTFMMLGWVLSTILIHGPIKLLNRMLGLVFGVVKGMFLSILILAILSLTPLNKSLEKAEGKSKLLPLLNTVAKPVTQRYKDQVLDVLIKPITPPTKNKPTVKTI